jgi:hypothetical protein
MSIRRREDEVRRMMDLPYPQVPAELVVRALARGARLLRFRRTARRLCWALVAAAAAVFLVWLVLTDPWSPPPAETTPPLQGW